LEEGNGIGDRTGEGREGAGFRAGRTKIGLTLERAVEEEDEEGRRGKSKGEEEREARKEATKEK